MPVPRFATESTYVSDRTALPDQEEVSVEMVRPVTNHFGAKLVMAEEYQDPRTIPVTAYPTSVLNLLYLLVKII